MVPHIRILQSYTNQSDAELIAAAGAVIQGMTGNAVFASPPVDLNVVQAAIDELNSAVASQAQGGTASTAHKNNKRAELIVVLRRLAHYVQDHCEGDVAKVLDAGFTVAMPNRKSTPLDKPVIAGIDFGKTTELVVKVIRVARAKCYEVRQAALGDGGSADEWQNAGLYTNSRTMTITGLTPGTTYAFQVRAIGGSTGATDWSDSVAHICV